MKTITIVTIALLSVMLVGAGVGLVYAFDPVFSYPHTVVSIGDNHFMVNYVSDGTIVSQDPLEIEWDNMWILTPIFTNETATTIVFHEDGRVELGGKGICLDDGTSSDGGTCYPKLTTSTSIGRNE